MSNPAHFIIKNGLLTKYVGFGGEVAIPEGVTEIGENAFSPEAPKLTAEQKLFRNNIVSVKFPNSVKKVGDCAFENCKAICSVSISDGMKEIGWRAFSGCVSLKFIEIPASVEKIGVSAFYKCPNLTIDASSGSVAAQYAKENGIPLGEFQEDPKDVSPVDPLTLSKWSDIREIFENYGSYLNFCKAKGKLFFDFNGTLGDKIWKKKANLTQKSISDYANSVPISGDSVWGSKLTVFKSKYQTQLASDAKEDISKKELLITAGEVLESGQRLEYFGADDKFTQEPYSIEDHFAKGDLSGSFSGVKFRGSLNEILFAYDDIMNLFEAFRVHMFSISCSKYFDGLTVEIQLEYSDYVTEKAFFTEIVKAHPALRMVAVSIPERKWENWFFFASGSHSTYISTKEVRYERTADFGCYYGRSDYFYNEAWFHGDFLFVEREKRVDVFVNDTFNWSKVLEFPSDYWGTKPLRFCAMQERYAQKIILPNVAKYIIGYSFVDCRKLKEVVMPSVTKINRNAFVNCKALKKMVVSEKLIDIEEEAFVDCGDFAVEAPEGSYAEKYFSNDEDFDNSNECDDPNFIVKNGVLFEYVGTDSRVVLPKGIREIGEGVFCRNLRITEVTLPNTVEVIGIGAFFGCSYLESITLPDGVKTISKSAFSKCKSLATVILPESVTIIEDSAFSECSALTEIDIPFSVTKIGFFAFRDCKNLAGVTLHSDDIAVGSEAFSGCKKLANKQKQVIVANILFDCFSNKKNLVIPEGVTALGDGALASCDNLESVTIPESVTAIGPRSFPSDITLKNRFTIHSPAGSYAEEWAKKNNLKFIPE